MNEILHLDWETRSTCDLKQCGLHVYAQDPTTDIWFASYAFDDEPVENWFPGEPVPQRIIDHVENEREVWAHNAAFEIEINNRIAMPRYGWPVMLLPQMVCTSVMAYAMSLPGNLDGAASAVGINHQKDMKGHRLMLQMCRPRKITESGSIIWWDDLDRVTRLADYGRQDVEVERELGKRLMRISKAEHELWQLDQEINNRGVQVDVPAIQRALQIVELEQARLDQEMDKLTNGEVHRCGAAAKLTAWIERQGVTVEGVAKTDVVELLEIEDLPERVRRALILRQEAAKSSTAKLKTMLDGVNADGRVRGCFQFHGSGTGRWAGRRIQLHNFPRPSLKQKQIDEVFEILSWQG